MEIRSEHVKLGDTPDGQDNDDIENDYRSPSISANDSTSERTRFPRYDNLQAPPHGHDLELGRNSESGTRTVSPTNSNHSHTRYDAVGIGMPPPPRTKPIRLGSAFYTTSQPNSPMDTARGNINRFEESFASASAATSTTLAEEEEGLVGGEDGERKRIEEKILTRKSTVRNRTSLVDIPSEWWASWKVQMGKLFVPQWRLTVILMWFIWGSMSFCKCKLWNGGETILIT